MAVTAVTARGLPMDTFRQDLRYAVRALRRAPGFTAVALLSITLGIGVNSTIFSLVSAVHFRPLPYRDAGRIVDLHELNPRDLCAGCAVGTSYATFLDWRASATSFEKMGAYHEDVFAVIGPERPERVQGGRVSADLFPMLGVAPVLGRPIAADEDRVGGLPVVLLSHALWQRQFGADSSLVGRTIVLNGTATTVVGVMPPGFKFPEFAELWTPIAPTATTDSRDDRSIGVLARLRTGVTVSQGDREMATLAAGLAAAHPGEFTNWTAGATTLRDDLNADSGPPFVLLLGASAFVLLIACANLANLLLARAMRRSRDFAVRSALGASRVRVARQLLTESLLLAMAGGGLGMLLALWGVDVVKALLPGQIPFWIDIRVDWRVTVFTLLASIATGLAFGIVPALRVSRPDLRARLKEGQRNASASASRGRLRSALVVWECAMALVLLAGAGLMIKTYLRSQRTDDLGYDPRGVLMANADLVQQRYQRADQIGVFGAELMAAVGRTAGADAAALETTRFLGTFVGAASAVTREGSSTPVPDNVVPRFAHGVTPAYFDVLRIALRAGRLFTDADGTGAEGVVIVNEAAAGALWPGENALGQRLKLSAPSGDAPWLTVVGIVGNTVASPFGRRGPTPLIYTSFAQSPSQPISILVRPRGTPAGFIPALRQAVTAIDPGQPLTSVGTMESFLADWVAPVGFFVRLLGALAVLALALAAVGIYGVVSYVVAQRTHEIGVRVALGASSRRILRLVVGHGLLLGAAGAALGLLGAFGLTRVLRQILFGTSPTDPVVLGGVTVVLVAVAMVATLVPARRALSVNPVEAMRAE